MATLALKDENQSPNIGSPALPDKPSTEEQGSPDSFDIDFELAPPRNKLSVGEVVCRREPHSSKSNDEDNVRRLSQDSFSSPTRQQEARDEASKILLKVNRKEEARKEEQETQHLTKQVREFQLRRVSNVVSQQEERQLLTPQRQLTSGIKPRSTQSERRALYQAERNIYVKDMNIQTNKFLKSTEKQLKQNMDHTSAEHNKTRKELQKSAQKQDRKLQTLQSTVERLQDTIVQTFQSGKPTHIDCVTTTTATSTLEPDEFKTRDELLEENMRLKNRNQVLSTPIATKERIETRRDAATKKHIQNLRNQNHRTK